MKPDYKNWMPKGMIFGFAIGTAVCAIIAGLSYKFLPDTSIRKIFTLAGDCGILLGVGLTRWSVSLYRAFDYSGKRKLSKQIVEGISAYITLPNDGICLDVGCGSGAVTIACAKKNPQATFVGIDHWGKEYASFSKQLCFQNAEAEGVTNVTFEKGNAQKMRFIDESFDAVTSNYVYHNIPVRDRQALLLETLRCLKKGGTFAVHDIFSKSKYGDMQKFVQKLRECGYEDVRLIDTTRGMFMSPKEAVLLGLSGSAILCGKK